MVSAVQTSALYTKLTTSTLRCRRPEDDTPSISLLSEDDRARHEAREPYKPKADADEKPLANVAHRSPPGSSETSNLPRQDDAPAQSLLNRGKLEDFVWTSSPQPHSVRRRAILDKYPEIEELYGADGTQAFYGILTVAIQFFLCYFVSHTNMPWYAYLAFVFIVSGTLNHSLFAAMHEGCHRTIFENKRATELFCILTTLPMGVPAAMGLASLLVYSCSALIAENLQKQGLLPFTRYHLDHHIYMGLEGTDPDIPTAFEAWFFRSTWRKFIWMMLMPVTYSMRPLLTIPKHIVPMEVFNWLLSLTVDICVWRYWGLKGLGYFLLGTFFSMNFHPFAGHFISEHFIFPDSDTYQETNSYYGIWNYLTYNVGFHNEHHDFPRVPGSRLPLVRQIAKEFYAMPHHHGWMRITWAFLLTPDMTPFNRVKRVGLRGGPVPEEHAAMKLHKYDLPLGGEGHFWPDITHAAYGSKRTPSK